MRKIDWTIPKVAWTAFISVIAAFFAAWFVVEGVFISPLEIKIAELEPYKQKFNAIEVSAPLYKSMPADIHYLVRGLEISVNEGVTHGYFAQYERWQLTVSKYQDTNPSSAHHNAIFTLLTENNGNRLAPQVWEMVLKKGNMTDDIWDGTYEFIVYIEDVSTKQVTLAVARRFWNSGLVMKNNRIDGQLRYGIDFPKRVSPPILLSDM